MAAAHTNPRVSAPSSTWTEVGLDFQVSCLILPRARCSGLAMGPIGSALKVSLWSVVFSISTTRESQRARLKSQRSPDGHRSGRRPDRAVERRRPPYPAGSRTGSRAPPVPRCRA